MSMHMRKAIAFAALALSGLGIVIPVFAQSAMQDMDMTMPHQVVQRNQSAKNAKNANMEKKLVPSSPRRRESSDLHATQATSGSRLRGHDEFERDAPQNQAVGAHLGMHDMDMHDGQAPQNARSADYSDGFGYGAMNGMDMHDDKSLGMLLLDRLEYFDGRGGNGEAFDAQAWYGNDANKLWLKAEGERESGQLQDLRVEALWDRPLDAFWDTQLGVRHDSGVGPDRSWLAFGVQGLAPYWLEVEATLYVGESGRTAFRFESEYELLLTQRLILQPRFEANLYGRDDPQRGIGSGLSDATLGLRLRYEFTRQFAPYVGVEFERRFGATASFARDAGGAAFDARVVAGVRAWF